MSKEKIVLIDGHSILNRAFYGIPPLTNSEGLHTNAVYGFLNIMFRILDEEKPQYLAVAFDLKAPTFRHKMYKEYKGTRKPMPEELREQVPLIKEMLTAMNVPLMMLEGYEADDLIGTVSLTMEKRGLDVTIISGDRDLLQLASDTTLVRIPKTKKGGTEIENYHTQDVYDRYQVSPHGIIELKALMGDASDNIPGIPGVGEKTATKIIAEYETIENAYEHAEEIKPDRAKKSLLEHWDLAQMSKTLATINRESPFEITLEDAHMGNIYSPEALQMCRRLEFKNLISRFEGAEGAVAQEEEEVFESAAQGETMSAFLKDTANIPAGEGSDNQLGVAILTEGDEVFGAALSLKGKAKYFPLSGMTVTAVDTGEATAAASAADSASTKTASKAANTEADGQMNFMDLLSMGDEADAGANPFATADDDAAADSASEAETADAETSGLRELETVLKTFAAKHGKHSISMIDVKSSYKFLQQVDRDAFFDCGVAAYLLNPLKNTYGYDDLSKDYCNKLVPSAQELLGKKSLKQMQEEDPQILVQLACRQAMTAAGSTAQLNEQLAETGMQKLFDEVEMPLVFTLFDMEQEGVMVRADELKTYGEELAVRIAELENRIYEEAGEKFNINSPKQLGVILFEKMSMPYGKKTKTGYSTAADVLEKLAEEYPLVADILEYRQLTKLKSTYADGLSAYIEADGRIHGKFNQTVTATGRISSTDPNLQNIPVRTELGRQLRKVFVPKDGYVFVDADYSQIELRVLASVSGDQILIDAYREAKDIHAITASQVFHVPLEEVTPQLRRNAKAVNFGIVYGISSFGLSNGLSISRKEAQQYIEQYFVTYPGIKNFLDTSVKDAKEKGYSVTLFGRRRPVPELSSGNFMQRSFGERVAMNAPIQGTAADIIKIAMVRVHDRLIQEGLKSRLILQVHDELLIETAGDELDIVSKLLREEMMGAADLAVPMEVDLNAGDSWYEAH